MSEYNFNGVYSGYGRVREGRVNHTRKRRKRQRALRRAAVELKVTEALHSSNSYNHRTFSPAGNLDVM